MARRFLAPYPIFGTKNKRLSIAYQQRSPYYWWWAYLRRNKDYLACCEAGGSGRYATLYADFGDIRVDDFRVWWMDGERGAKLFAESYGEPKLVELDDPSQWSANWTKENMLVIAAPLTSSKRYLQSRFAALLKQRHEAVRGRPKKAEIQSNALYKLGRNYTIDNLRITLDVYDEYQRTRGTTPKVTLWQIGESLKLVKTAMTSSRLTPKENYDRKNVMGATVKRYIKNAEKMIEEVANGVFPS